jgi:hypothetical protein
MLAPHRVVAQEIRGQEYPSRRTFKRTRPVAPQTFRQGSKMSAFDS